MRCTETDCNNTKSETSSHRKEIPGSARQHPTSPQSSLDPVAQMSLLGREMAAVLGDVLHTMCITDLFLENPDPVHEDFQSQGTQINNCRCVIIYIRDQKSPLISGSAQIPVLLSSGRALPNLPGTDPSPAALKHLESLPQECDGQ